MPTIEEIALKDLVKHPKAFIIYALCIGVGWLTNRLVPDECHQEVGRWQTLYYMSDRRRDSLQKTKDILYEDLITQKQENSKHHQQDQHTDSLVNQLERKAETVLKPRNHVTAH